MDFNKKLKTLVSCVSFSRFSKCKVCPVFNYKCSVQFSSVAQLCLTLCDPMNCSTPSLPVHHQTRSSLKLTSIELVMPSSHLILCRPLLLQPSIFPSIRVFSNESALHIRWPEYWSFSLSISPSNEHPGLISIRMDWLDLLAVQGTLKSSLIMWVEIGAASLDPVDQGMERIGLRFLSSCISRLNQSS